jgi:hypothetical protein
MCSGVKRVYEVTIDIEIVLDNAGSAHTRSQHILYMFMRICNACGYIRVAMRVYVQMYAVRVGVCLCMQCVCLCMQYVCVCMNMCACVCNPRACVWMHDRMYSIRVRVYEYMCVCTQYVCMCMNACAYACVACACACACACNVYRPK